MQPIKLGHLYLRCLVACYAARYEPATFAYGCIAIACAAASLFAAGTHHILSHKTTAGNNINIFVILVNILPLYTLPHRSGVDGAESNTPTVEHQSNDQRFSPRRLVLPPIHLRPGLPEAAACLLAPVRERHTIASCVVSLHGGQREGDGNATVLAIR